MRHRTRRTGKIGFVLTSLLVGALAWRAYVIIRQEHLNRALIAAIHKNAAAAALTYLERGADPNTRERTGAPRSLWAELLALLTGRGRQSNADGPPVLVLAVEQNDTAVVRALLARGANDSATTGDAYTHTALTFAAGNGHFEIVKLLLDRHTHISAKELGIALWDAAAEDHSTVVKLLLTKGAHPDFSTKMDNTALCHAAANGDKAMVEALLAAGARPNACIGYGTPLMEAAGRGDLPIVNLLLAKGADVTPKDDAGETALTLAKKKKRADIVALLKRAGARE